MNGSKMIVNYSTWKYKSPLYKLRTNNYSSVNTYKNSGNCFPEKMPMNMPQIQIYLKKEGESRRISHAMVYCYDQFSLKVLANCEDKWGLYKAVFGKRRNGASSFKTCHPYYFEQAEQYVKQEKGRIKKKILPEQILERLSLHTLEDMTGHKTCMALLEELSNMSCYDEIDRDAYIRFDEKIKMLSEALSHYQVTMGYSTAMIVREIIRAYAGVEEYKKESLSKVFGTITKVLETVNINTLEAVLYAGIRDEFFLYRNLQKRKVLLGDFNSIFSILDKLYEKTMLAKKVSIVLKPKNNNYKRNLKVNKITNFYENIQKSLFEAILQ